MKKNGWVDVLIISVLGVLSIILPTFILQDVKQYESPLFSIIRTGIEGFSVWSIIFLFSTGFGMKFYTKLSGWKIGLSTMALFPIMAMMEMIVDSNSHNMFPFEFIVYAITTIPGIIGAYIAQVVQKALVKN